MTVASVTHVYLFEVHTYCLAVAIMVLRPEVVQAFNTLNINPDDDQATASKAYKRLALIHHPDRNHNDSTATQRFQEASLYLVLFAAHIHSPLDWRSMGYLPASL